MILAIKDGMNVEIIETQKEFSDEVWSLVEKESELYNCSVKVEGNPQYDKPTN